MTRTTPDQRAHVAHDIAHAREHGHLAVLVEVDDADAFLADANALAETEQALAEVHRVTGRGDGHGKPSDTAACIIDAFTTERIDHGDEVRELKRERDEAEAKVEQHEAAAEVFQQVRDELKAQLAAAQKEAADVDDVLSEAAVRTGNNAPESVGYTLRRFIRRALDAEAQLAARDATIGRLREALESGRELVRESAPLAWAAGDFDMTTFEHAGAWEKRAHAWLNAADAALAPPTGKDGK